MRVVEVATDDTMVSGYEYHTLQCTGCDDVERRLVFSREGISRAAKPAPPSPPPAASAMPAEPAPAPPPLLASPDEPLQSAAEPISSVAASTPPEPPPAEPTPSLTTSPAAASTAAEAAPSPAAAAPSAEAPAVASPPTEPAPTATTQPSSVTAAADGNLDEDEALLRRAIEMVRGPARGSQPTNGLADGKPATPSELAGAMRSKKPLTGRVVQIQRDPDEPSFVAKDTKSGLSVLRHQDSARLRAMCDRIGWQVVDG
jgi:hypothetical protein